jgi:hypothetical protein
MKISSPKAINWTLKQYGYRAMLGRSFAHHFASLQLDEGSDCEEKERFRD